MIRRAVLLFRPDLAHFDRTNLRATFTHARPSMSLRLFSALRRNARRRGNHRLLQCGLRALTRYGRLMRSCMRSNIRKAHRILSARDLPGVTRSPAANFCKFRGVIIEQVVNWDARKLNEMRFKGRHDSSARFGTVIGQRIVISHRIIFRPRTRSAGILPALFRPRIRHVNRNRNDNRGACEQLRNFPQLFFASVSSHGYAQFFKSEHALDESDIFRIGKRLRDHRIA